MKISVVMPVFNGARTIRNSIDSILSQDYADREVLVIDGGSTDGTLDILNSYGDQLEFISERDRGTSDAMNKGILRARGEVITMLNADDRFHAPDVLRSAAEEFARDPQLDILFADILTFDPRSGLAHARLPSRPERLPYRMTVHSAGAFIKTALHRTRLYDLSFRIATDYDLFNDLITRRRARVKVVPKIHVSFDLGGMSNDVKNTFLIARENFRVRRTYYGLAWALPFFVGALAVSTLRRLRFRPFYWWRTIRMSFRKKQGLPSAGKTR